MNNIPTRHLDRLYAALCQDHRQEAKPLRYSVQDDDYTQINVYNGKYVISIRDKKAELKASLEFGEHELKMLLVNLLEWFTEGEVINGEPMTFTLDW